MSRRPAPQAGGTSTRTLRRSGLKPVTSAAASSTIAPPNVPADRVKALRAAFAAMIKDKAFLEEARKLNLDIDFVPGEELQKIVADIIDAPADVKKRLADVLSLVEREKK